MTIYDVFFFVFSLVYLPYLAIKGKAHRDFAQRFGRLSGIFTGIKKAKPIWIHAVSVGEVLAVKNFVNMLHARFPGRSIALSTTTKTGNDVAKKILAKDILKFYFPLDFSFVIRRAVDIINPSILIITETEIWPNLVLELSKRKIPIVLLNGRISDRSFRGYRKIKFFFGHILERINLFCMQTKQDAERIEALGARAKEIKTTGNMKFDIADKKGFVRSRKELGLGESDELLIAGSTHRGEEEVMLNVYAKLKTEFQNLRLLIAPRHIDQAETIKKIAERMGLETILISQKRESSPSGRAVFILDTLGELSQLYSLATIVFMAGSLIKRGGHNLVEPAIFGKPILFGPYMFNFKDMARSFLEHKGALEVKDERELFEALKLLLRNKNKRDLLGSAAKELIDASRGATLRNISLVEQLIKGSEPYNVKTVRT